MLWQSLKKLNIIFKKQSWNSLVVQWLGFCALTTAVLGSVPLGELRFHKPHSTAKKIIKNCHLTKNFNPKLPIHSPFGHPRN